MAFSGRLFGSRLSQAMLLLLAISACSHVGAPQAMTPPEDGLVELRLCVLTNLDGITAPDDLDFLSAMQGEFAQYGIAIVVPWVKPWGVGSIDSSNAISQLSKIRLPIDCDRLFAIVAPTPIDFIGGLLGIEILGAVDKRTHTRGFIRGEKVSLNQAFFPPSDVAIHETYHLLGCNDGFDDDDCLRTMMRLRAAAKDTQGRKSHFFPANGKGGVRVIYTRKEVDLLQGSVKSLED